MTMGLPTKLDPSQDLGLPFSNYVDVADPATDLDATYYENLCIGVAGLSLAAPRAWVVVSAAATAAARVKAHSAVWGDSASVKPTVATTAVGTFVVTWASSYPDLNPTASRAVTSVVALRACTVQMNAAGANWATVAGSTCTVRTTTLAGTAAARDFTLAVY